MDNLKRLRSEKGLTQTAIAKKVGVTGQAISNYEKGIREPNLGTVKKLASVLEVTVDKLLEEVDDDA